MHYLIVDPAGPPVVHHRRLEGGKIETTLVPADGILKLDPPGLEVPAMSLTGDR